MLLQTLWNPFFQITNTTDKSCTTFCSLVSGTGREEAYNTSFEVRYENLSIISQTNRMNTSTNRQVTFVFNLTNHAVRESNSSINYSLEANSCPELWEFYIVWCGEKETETATIMPGAQRNFTLNASKSHTLSFAVVPHCSCKIGTREYFNATLRIFDGEEVFNTTLWTEALVVSYMFNLSINTTSFNLSETEDRQIQMNLTVINLGQSHDDIQLWMTNLSEGYPLGNVNFSSMAGDEGKYPMRPGIKNNSTAFFLPGNTTVFLKAYLNLSSWQSGYHSFRLWWSSLNNSMLEKSIVFKVRIGNLTTSIDLFYNLTCKEWNQSGCVPVYYNGTPVCGFPFYEASVNKSALLNRSGTPILAGRNLSINLRYILSSTGSIQTALVLYISVLPDGPMPDGSGTFAKTQFILDPGQFTYAEATVALPEVIGYYLVRVWAENTYGEVVAECYCYVALGIDLSISSRVESVIVQHGEDNAGFYVEVKNNGAFPARSAMLEITDKKDNRRIVLLPLNEIGKDEKREERVILPTSLLDEGNNTVLVRVFDRSFEDVVSFDNLVEVTVEIEGSRSSPVYSLIILLAVAFIVIAAMLAGRRI
ncbi:MAG: hypothetical protein QW728_04805 [Thermoplasmata archaeon]